jgi:4,5-DOPA dioxygenase extradiol
VGRHSRRGGSLGAGEAEAVRESRQKASNGRFPVGFVGHGNPLSVLDTRKAAEWRAWAATLPVPSAVLAVSAHWEGAPLTLGSTRTHTELVYDFWGFPDEMYRLRYPAPGAPWLAETLNGLLGDVTTMAVSERSLDHGVWIPLLRMWPDAGLPVLQISMPASMSDETLFEVGRTLAPLRDEGVFILGSGNLVHDLRHVDFAGDFDPPPYAVEFDTWVAGRLEEHDHRALVAWRDLAPAPRQAHPSAEHFRPILVAAGAGGSDGVCFPVEGFENRTVSRRCVQFG